MTHSTDIRNINNLITRYTEAKARDNKRKSSLSGGDRGWNSHAVRASRLGQRIAQAARDDASAKAAVIEAGLQNVYYRYTLDPSIFRVWDDQISELGRLL